MALRWGAAVIADLGLLAVPWLKAGLVMLILLGPPVVLVGGVAGVVALFWRAGRIRIG